MVTGTWASKVGLEKELRSNAPMARGDVPATTGSVGERGALANVEHIQVRLRVVEGGVNGGVAAKI